VVDGEWAVTCPIDKLNLMPRLYHVWCGMNTAHGHMGLLVDWQEVMTFRVVGPGEEPVESQGAASVTFEAIHGAIRTDYQFTRDRAPADTAVTGTATMPRA
jgi:hypothetical protein